MTTPAFTPYGSDLFGNALTHAPGARPGALAQRFTIPPLSVLNAREGEWQGRKRAWLAVGLESEIGRDDDSLGYSDTIARLKPSAEKEGKGTSIFDPVLCELACTWWCPATGQVLDPFAGGSVRGIVAALLGRAYHGIDLRPEQIAANEAQAARITPGNRPVWHVGDSRSAPLPPADFLFSCPPYGNLERYSDDPLDLSAMEHAAFVAAYREIVARSVAALRPDRFACFVVGDFRDKRGNYRDFVSETIRAFTDAGAHLYNEAILVTAVGSLPIRVGKQFDSGRKLGKTHQNVLVFVKGDGKRAADACNA